MELEIDGLPGSGKTYGYVFEPHTHPIPNTLRGSEASWLAKRLVWSLLNVIKPEEAYYIAELYLDLARMEGPRDATD